MAAQYEIVNKEAKSSGCWTPFLKQLHVSSGIWTLFFMNGVSCGAPTVIIPQIRKNWNSDIDDDLASWLYSASNFAALPWLFFLPALSKFIGRKIPYITCCVAMSIVFTLLYFSAEPYHILIAEVIQGFVNAIAVTTLIHFVPEYCNRRYRNMFLNIQCTSYYWGMWAANVLGSFFDWKYIAILGVICTLYSFTVCFCPESPRWLASRGKITECQEAHNWLHGYGAEAEKELRDLIKSQTDYSNDDLKATRPGFLQTLKCKQFYMPLLLVILVTAQYTFSGKLVCSIYAIDIFKKITKDEDTAYTGMLILDGVTVSGMYVGSFVSKFLKLRVMYFSLSFVSIFMMFTFSLYLYLTKLGVISESNAAALTFLVIYSLAISSGPIILSLNFYSELISLKYQALSYAIISVAFLIMCTGMLKFTPVLFEELGLHGSFLFYGIACGVATILLYVYLPETKNKTLQEIEDCFKDSERLPEAEKLTKAVNC